MAFKLACNVDFAGVEERIVAHLFGLYPEKTNSKDT